MTYSNLSSFCPSAWHNLVWPLNIKAVRFSARTACELPLSWVGKQFAMALSDLAVKNPRIVQLRTSIFKKSSSFFLSFDLLRFVYFTVSHLVRGDTWSQTDVLSGMEEEQLPYHDHDRFTSTEQHYKLFSSSSTR